MDETAQGGAGDGAATDTAGDQASLLRRALKSAGGDAARYLPVRFIPALTSLVTVPLFTRLIAKADYGDYFLMNSVTTLMSSLAIAWLGTSAVRFFWPSRKEGRSDEFAATTVWLTVGCLVGAASLVGTAIWLGREALPAGVVRLAPVALACFLVNYLYTILLQMLRASNRAGQYARLSIAYTALTTVFSIVFVWLFKTGAWGIFAGLAVGSAIMVPFALRGVAAEGSVSPRHIARPMAGELLRYGLPLVPVGVSSWVLVLLDRFVIEWARGAAEVGVYSVAYGLGQRLMELVTLPLLLTMAPMVVQAFEQNGQDLAERMQTQFTRYFAMVTLPLLAGLASASGPFMTVFTGPAYREAYSILPVVAAGVMLSALAQIASQGLSLKKRTPVILANALTAAAFNVVANVMLVPVYGYRAAAWTTVASYGLMLFLMWYRSRDAMRWRIPWPSLWRIALASAIMAVAVWAAFAWATPSLLTLVLQVVLGIVIYVALLVALRVVRPDEAAFVRSIGMGAVRRLGIRAKRA
jgi:O-antigen/teichoic acid export membrane protein